jgi:hypothetical protein
MEEYQSIALPLFFGISGILLNIFLVFFPPSDGKISEVVGSNADRFITGAIALTIPLLKKNQQ